MKSLEPHLTRLHGMRRYARPSFAFKVTTFGLPFLTVWHFMTSDIESFAILGVPRGVLLLAWFGLVWMVSAARIWLVMRQEVGPACEATDQPFPGVYVRRVLRDLVLYFPARNVLQGKN